MSDLCVAQNFHVEKANDPTSSADAKTGTLKSEGKNYTFEFIPDTESVTEGVDQFLQNANSQDLPEAMPDHEYTYISSETIEIEQEIEQLQQELELSKSSEESQEQTSTHTRFSSTQKQAEQLNQTNKKQALPHSSAKEQSSANGRSEEVYSSIFSLAKSMNTSRFSPNTQKETEHKSQQQQKQNDARFEFASISVAQSEKTDHFQENRYDKQEEGKKDQDDAEQQQQGFDQQQKKRQNQNQAPNKKTKISSIFSVQASREETRKTLSRQASVSSSSSSAHQKSDEVVEGIENIYIRFMALMAKILGQAEYEAHQLYTQIKARTDNVDALTLLISKINSEKEAIDWSENDEMKALLQKAREIGVDIPEGKLTWSEEEKKMLKENIQMRKDSLEKITQLERTDMQRYLQEASQCHQARSNVLKLINEVNNTIIHNMRPN